MNGNGLVVSEDEVGWVNLVDNLESETKVEIAMSVDTEAERLNCNIKNVLIGYDAFAVKKKYDDQEEKLVNYINNQGLQDIIKLRSANYEANNKPYFVAIEGSNELEVAGDKIIIKPFLGFPIAKNSLIQKKRNYPVDFVYKSAKSISTTINIPDGYESSALPEPYRLENDLVSINLEFSEQSNAIKAVGIYKFKKAVYQPEDYSRIKSALDSIVERFNAQIVLSKY